MALNVLVIPEDFRKDQYILKPLISKMMERLGKTARVQVCRDPLLGGVREALKPERIQEIIERYRGMIRLFLLIVDRDAELSRRSKLDVLEEFAKEQLGPGRFLAQEAIEEVEVWLLAGLRDCPSDWVWRDIRACRDSKDIYFDPMARRRGLSQAPYEGRDVLAREASSNYARIRQLCPEDFGVLVSRQHC